MLVILAAVSSLAISAQANVGRDTLSARVEGDSTHTVVDSTHVSGAPRLALARVTVGAATFAPTGEEKSDSVATQRRRAIEHSDWYYKRLTIHKAASFATIPLFVGEYIVGDKLYKGEGTNTTRAAHGLLASDAGFVATAAMAPEGFEGQGFEPEGASGRRRHRAVAVGSMGVSLVSYLMMYLWK